MKEEGEDEAADVLRKEIKTKTGRCCEEKKKQEERKEAADGFGEEKIEE